MKLRVPFLLYAAVLLVLPHVGFGQAPPPLGAATSFALFTAVGAVNNSGPTLINGDIGTNAGAFNGFPPGVVNGSIHVADTRATQAATAVQTAYGYYSTNIPCVTPLAVYGGTPAVALPPGSYCVGGATTLAGTLILDAGGDPNAKFYLSVSGALTTGANSVVLLQNSANADNVYWQIGGLVTLGQNSVMVGTLLVDGAINMIQGATLTGRGLSRGGAITIDTNNASLPNAVVAPVVTSTSWLGTALGGIDTDWFKPVNWSAGVPTSTVDAIVGTGRSPFPVINSGTASANALTIGASASLTQGGGSLDLKGNLNNGGTISATSGTVSVSGTNSQLIGGSGSTQFWNLSVNNANGALQSGAVSIHGVLAPASGNLTTNSQTLTLLSDAAGTALVDNTGTGAVLGNATVQRYIDPSLNAGPGYRHFSAPVSNTTIADLATGSFTPVVNPAYNTAPVPGNVTPFPTVFGYDETRVTTSGNPAPQDFDKGYFSPNATADPMTVGRGYTVNIPAGLTPDFVGTLNNGAITRSGLTRGTQTASGWHLLGNPYPAPLNWDLVGRTNLDAAVYVYRSTGQYAGTYSSYVAGGAGTNGGTNVIGSSQGFFVRVSTPGSSNGALSFTNAARFTTYQSPVFQRTSAITGPLVRLELRAATGPADEAVVYLEPGATVGFDAAMDAYKLLAGGAPILASELDATNRLSINALPPLTTGAPDRLVALQVQAQQAGPHTLRATELLNLAPAGTFVYLRDALTGAVVDLQVQPSYSFTVAAGAAATGRFALLLTQSRVTATAPATLSQQIGLYPNPARQQVTLQLPASLDRQPVAVSVLNALGQQVLTRVLPATRGAEAVALPLTALAKGVYTVRLTTPQGLVTKRLVVE